MSQCFVLVPGSLSFDPKPLCPHLMGTWVPSGVWTLRMHGRARRRCPGATLVASAHPGFSSEPGGTKIMYLFHRKEAPRQAHS